jgi:acyl dehydratase
MRVFKDFDEIKSAVGTEIGVSDWSEITQEQMDVERAKRELPGQTTIAHGLLTLALAPEFIRGVARVAGLKRTLNYGANRIRYLAPVPAGSRLRGRVSVAAADEVPPDGLRVTYGITIEIEGSGRPACVAELIALHYR